MANESKKLDEIIRKVDNGYRLISKSGRNLGTYSTKEGAKNRERQVQYFKHINEQLIEEGKADSSLEEKSKKFNIPLRTLKAVFRRGVSA